MFGALFAAGASKKKAVEVKRSSTAQIPDGKSKKVNPKPAPAASKPAATSTKRKLDAPAPSKAKHLKANPVSRRSQSVQTATPLFGSEDSESEDEAVQAAKRRRLAAEELDKDRYLRRKDMFLDTPATADLQMIHAADIPVLDKTARFAVLLDEFPEYEVLEFQYPSRAPREKFKLLLPLHDSHGYQSVSDIVESMREIAANFLPEDIAEEFDNESTGYPRLFQRAIKKKEPETIREVIHGWNEALLKLVQDGTVAKVLDAKHSLRPSLVERILNQAYSRTVSANLKALKKYQSGTDNVYGELLPKFVTKILKEDIRLKSDQVFVDLGSGVGNVVLQAALETGCESWGCEMMPDYCRVADLQQVEFEARARLWGLRMGPVRLEKGNFIENTAIKKALSKADAVLVNNQVFTPATNEALTTLFLDLKDGCKIVSLKSFVPTDHKITARNLNSPYNLLKVEKKRYFSECVSWTNEGGTYFVSVKDSKRVENFLKKQQRSNESDGSP